jgi:hypothetical protein
MTPITLAGLRSGTVLAAALLALAACGGNSPTPTAGPTVGAPATTAAPAPAAPAGAAASTPATSAAPPAAGSGKVTFDGDYTGTVTAVECDGTGPGFVIQVGVTFGAGPGSVPGTVSAQEFGWRDPFGDQFDSGYLSTPLVTDGKSYVLDGVKLTDQSNGKTITAHGTLGCP